MKSWVGVLARQASPTMLIV